ncbi:MAG: ShlB/FhaC/HecB family hemolysin secretion/activation protein [Pseudomonadota bacterium]|mgnify:CR=1 FL=1
MKKINVLAAAVLLSTGAHALTQQEIDAAARESQKLTGQEQQRQEAERLRQDGQKAPSGSNLNVQGATPSKLRKADGSCPELKRIQFKGSKLIDEWELEVFEAPFLGYCITPELASQVLASATNFYLTRGFITSRAYLPNQNLKAGVLDVVISEGQVADVVVKAEKPLNVGTVFVKDPDLGLNIRDLEQAVDQMNAVPGNNVVMAVLPGTQEQTSQVIFNNTGKPGVKGRVSLDNTGTEATGVHGASLALQAGDLLSLNDVWAVNARQSIGPKEKSSDSFSLDIKVPHGYNTYGFAYNKGGFDTLLMFPSSGAQLTSEGANESWMVSANRVIHRDQSSKHTVGLKLKRDSVESYIANTRINVNSRTLDALVLSSESVLGFDRNVLILTPEISVGLSEVDNLPVGVNTPLENPQSEYLRYKLSLDWSQPFTLSQQSWRWKSKFVGQYAEVPLYGSQQLIVGGASSVRGSHSVSITGDRGFYWQNTLSLDAKHAFNSTAIKAEYSVGYDFGRVRSNRALVSESRMEALVLGASFSAGGPWSLSLTHAIPVSVKGVDGKGDKHTSAVLSLDF